MSKFGKSAGAGAHAALQALASVPGGVADVTASGAPVCDHPGVSRSLDGAKATFTRRRFIVRSAEAATIPLAMKFASLTGTATAASTPEDVAPPLRLHVDEAGLLLLNHTYDEATMAWCDENWTWRQLLDYEGYPSSGHIPLRAFRFLWQEHGVGPRELDDDVSDEVRESIVFDNWRLRACPEARAYRYLSGLGLFRNPTEGTEFHGSGGGLGWSDECSGMEGPQVWVADEDNGDRLQKQLLALGESTVVELR